MRFRALILFLVSLGPVAAAQGATFNLAETKDGSVYSFSPTSSMFGFSFGPPGYLAVATSDVISGDVHDFNSYMQFSLTPLTSAGVTAAQVGSATITLQTSNIAFYAFAHSNPPTPSLPYTVDLYAASGSWNSLTTWNTAPAPTTALPIDSEIVTNVSSGPTLVTTTFDVTGLVKSWLNGSLANNGVLLKGHDIVGNIDDGYTSVLFTSRGYNTVNAEEQVVFVPQSGGPVLNVVTVPEPSSVVLLALAGLGLAAWKRSRRGPRG